MESLSTQCWFFDVGEMDCDKYEDQRIILNELYPPDPERNSVQFNLLQFEDILF